MSLNIKNHGDLLYSEKGLLSRGNDFRKTDIEAAEI